MDEQPRGFKLLSRPTNIEMIARGRGIDILPLLRKRYGGHNWKKLKGVANIEEDHGWIGKAEVHWFEAHGVGRVLWKRKRRLE